MGKLSGAFSVAKRELSAAERHFKNMKECESFDDMDIEWRGFIVSIEKVWKKIERAGVAVNRGKFGQFQKPYKAQKKQDRLLNYILHARNSDEHSVQEVTGHLSNYSCTPIGIVQRTMGKPDVFVPVNPLRKPAIKMDIKFELVDVTDRGQAYSPPWGNGVPGPMSPVEAAETALNFYRNYMNAFVAEFGA
ncbi:MULTISPECIES: hypothetical protein [Vibrio]|uniref:hypothetical protein n=1 Tax=Vibrio TaxID=662 RepID=UPI00159E5E2D|nr:MULTISPECIES: hypothetical protein [Vibrio]NVN81105.1 hypothetical protein [Vibrio sp. Scap16]QLE95109.1 hypothetical protein FLM53_19085 [Vibrio sp. Scap24]